MRDLTGRAIEAGLERAITRSVPDVFGAVTAAPLPAGARPALEVLPPARRAAHPARRAALGLCACLVLALCLGGFSFFRAAAVIGIDVNPSIELTANRYDRVLDVRALNGDAKAVIGDMQLKYLDLDTAVNALIGSMVRQGYLEDEGGAVLVSVSGGSEDYNVRIQRRVAQDIESALAVTGGKASVYTQDVTGPDRRDPAPTPEPEPTPEPSPSAPPATPAPTPTPAQPAATQPPAAPAPSPKPTPAPTPRPAPPDPATARQRARANGISYGKQVFIDRLRGLDPTLDEGMLAGLSIGRIARLVEDRGLDIRAIVDFDDDDSVKDNIDDFIDDVDDDDDDDDDDRDDHDDDDDDDDDDRDDHDDDDDD